MECFRIFDFLMNKLSLFNFKNTSLFPKSCSTTFWSLLAFPLSLSFYLLHIINIYICFKSNCREMSIAKWFDAVLTKTSFIAAFTIAVSLHFRAFTVFWQSSFFVDQISFPSRNSFIRRSPHKFVWYTTGSIFGACCYSI